MPNIACSTRHAFTRDNLLRVEVEDSGDGRPEVKATGDTDDHGRGLFLVAEIADDWGVSPRKGPGKVVWCEFKVGTYGPDPITSLGDQLPLDEVDQ